MHTPPAFNGNIRKLALFESGDLLCGLDITYVQEINKNIAVTVVHRAPQYVCGVINLRGEIVTVIDLRTKFGFAPLSQDEETQIVVVRQGDESIGLLVDSVSDVVLADEKDIEPPPSNLAGVTGHFFNGIYKLEHSLVAILNIDELLIREHE
ncbi:MAG: chemotaxis protein CheW [Desulfobulbaceae bacterium]|nr:chemotaxis protein CheW [Desulfobulbaceae bacterium]